MVAAFDRKNFMLYLFLIVFNIGAWALALVTFHQHPLLVGSSLLAYSFGLHHAVDADHIAAIDNVIRKLMHADRRLTTVGLMFSLGHSTVVIAASIAIAITAGAAQTWIAHFKTIGGLVGALVSTTFLLSLAAKNLAVLRSVIGLFAE
jgi:nickel/cobalt transporter (NiCoT) family protein